MATRLVAFAEVIGIPRKVSIGTENNEPPPPTVFRKAAAKPVIITRGIWYNSIIWKRYNLVLTVNRRI